MDREGKRLGNSAQVTNMPLGSIEIAPRKKGKALRNVSNARRIKGNKGASARKKRRKQVEVPPNPEKLRRK